MAALDARERAGGGRQSQFKATHSREAEAARLHAALSSQFLALP